LSKLYVLNGPEIGDVFEVKDGTSFLGRAEDNDIRISDKTVSRKHLRIAKIGDRHFITDLNSRNGTYYDGKYLNPDNQVEVREGFPVALGMTVIGIGKACLEYLVPFLGLIEITKEPSAARAIWGDNRDKTKEKIDELLYRVSDLLMKSLPVRETAHEILHHVFDFLKRIDRGAFVLLDPETREIKEIVFESRNPTDDISTSFCRDVVNRVIEHGKPVVVFDADVERDEGLEDTLEIYGIKSVMCVPLINRLEMVGVIYVDSLERPSGFRKHDVSLLMDLGQRTAMAIGDTSFRQSLLEAAEELPLAD